MTGIRVFRIMAEPDGILAATLYSGDEATLIDASTED